MIITLPNGDAVLASAITGITASEPSIAEAPYTVVYWGERCSIIRGAESTAQAREWRDALIKQWMASFEKNEGE